MGKPRRVGCYFVLIFAILAALLSSVAFGEAHIVRDGRAQAEIIIAETPTRMQKLAAEELQLYVEKISGARLPLRNAPSGDAAVQIYVGQSPHTERLKLSVEGLHADAFRMVSGPTWLALLGDDKDYVPREMDAKTVPDRARVRAAFDARTAPDFWVDSVGPNMDRSYHAETGWWQGDRRGSLNAVYEFLYGLGVRWYMPGPLGEIVPTLRTISLPALDRTVRPEFELRHHNLNRYDQISREDILWYYRLGLNHGVEFAGYGGAHGINSVHGREETKKAHPEYYAVWGGKRRTDCLKAGAPCLSSEALFQATVRYARAIFDIYDEPMVDISVADNLGKSGMRCECEDCQAQYTLARPSGTMSDYVFGFVNRVALEVHKTHPGKFIRTIAYQNNLLPPEKIDKLSPNIVVGIASAWRSKFAYPELQNPRMPRIDELRRAWREKVTSGRMYTWEYYLLSRPDRGEWAGAPAYFMRSIAEDLRAIRAIPEMKGEFIEVTRIVGRTSTRAAEKERLGSLHAPGFNHLNVYVTARLYWDVQQDVGAMLEEYYRLFYGPAAAQMKAFIEYSEANWPKMSSGSKDAKPIDEMLALLAAAREAAGDTVYGQRVQLMVDYVQPLRQLRETVSRARTNVPGAEVYVTTRHQLPKLDGKLDDTLWNRTKAYALVETEKGGKPSINTTFRVTWADGAIYFGIRCDDPDMAKITLARDDKNPMGILDGDAIELLIETQPHSYYQLAISPTGRFVDIDRSKGVEPRWESNAKVAVHRGDTFWSAEVMIPVNEDQELMVNPLLGVIGRMPTPAAPWHFNVCRQRIRGQSVERYSFSPTMQPSFHEISRFAEMRIK